MSKFHSNYIITMKDIVREGDPILNQATKEVSLPPSEEDKETLISMMNFLKNSQDPNLAKKYNLRPGVGLSANQIGLNKRMFTAFLTDEKGKEHEYAMINPKIISHSVSMIYLPQGEGCLSVDRDIKGFVPRYERIKVKGFNLTGEEVLLKLSGYSSIVVQHEIDHLDGIMFYDRMNKENPFQLPDNIKSLY
ncbi:peptide deformylase [Heyndrickxia oleronia]|uniref:peptide deformylase n=1 Tax=Heyndrickxia oleronia TaxID=38875 RepID=UPI00242DAECF|nr:peptide deformylase [Heyndrickxia oleronia]MCI1593609.1 peptide deformylase [Heyndrickxia oleronia]MCI1615991.1 peptide deformylase [Heyndrickxia oleronia]MCI1746586.1 peptide deformylase [Heyndrickxia oleronia]MCI1764370.1 peptide deformylase [Heyndrickxia oleronia]